MFRGWWDMLETQFVWGETGQELQQRPAQTRGETQPPNPQHRISSTALWVGRGSKRCCLPQCPARFVLDLTGHPGLCWGSCSCLGGCC